MEAQLDSSETCSWNSLRLATDQLFNRIFFFIPKYVEVIDEVGLNNLGF